MTLLIVDHVCCCASKIHETINFDKTDHGALPAAPEFYTVASVLLVLLGRRVTSKLFEKSSMPAHAKPLTAPLIDLRRWIT